MKISTRSIYRWIHIVVAIPIYGYIYSPFKTFRSMHLRPGTSSFLSWCLPDC